MGITLDQAKGLKYGDILYHIKNRNSDGTPQRWKVNGKPKVWKTQPGRVRVPLKHGLYRFDYIDQYTLYLVELDEEKAMGRK